MPTTVRTGADGKRTVSLMSVNPMSEKRMCLTQTFPTVYAPAGSDWNLPRPRGRGAGSRHAAWRRPARREMLDDVVAVRLQRSPRNPSSHSRLSKNRPVAAFCRQNLGVPEAAGM